MFSVVVSTPDVVGERMAGPGIRALHLAEELAKHFPTTLIAQLDGSLPATDAMTIVPRQSAEAETALAEADVLIGQPARRFHRRRKGQRIVFDLFDPVVLELRELYGAHPSARQRIHLAAEWWRLRRALQSADLLIAATPAQRRFYDSIHRTRAPWVEVPFGLDLSEVAVVAESLPSDENLVIWGGGIWEWLDPALAVDAIVRLNEEGLSCRLLFLGRARPNDDLLDRRRNDRFDLLLRDGGPYVGANDSWVPYRERLSWLRRGKIAIMLHRPTSEAEYSIRTRLFDAIAAGIPVVATTKGFAAELIEREGLGIVVPPSDIGSVAEAVRRLLTDDDLYAQCVSNLGRIRPRFAWDVVTRPLVETVSRWQKPAER